MAELCRIYLKKEGQDYVDTRHKDSKLCEFGVEDLLSDLDIPGTHTKLRLSLHDKQSRNRIKVEIRVTSIFNDYPSVFKNGFLMGDMPSLDRRLNKLIGKKVYLQAEYYE